MKWALLWGISWYLIEPPVWYYPPTLSETLVVYWGLGKKSPKMRLVQKVVCPKNSFALLLPPVYRLCL